MWSIVPNCTKDSKLILLQWKAAYDTIISPTYKYLFKIKVQQSYVCSTVTRKTR